MSDKMVGGFVTHREIRNAHILSRKSQGKKLFSRYRRRREDNIRWICEKDRV
jgi:hypothetical protein